MDDGLGDVVVELLGIGDLRVDLLAYDVFSSLDSTQTARRAGEIDAMDHPLFKIYGAGGDGLIARGETPVEAHILFDRADANADGVLTLREAAADLKRRLGLGRAAR